MKKIDLTGNRYGHLTVLKENGKRGKNILWLCRCDCGNDIKALMECDAICLCPCWEKSKGCQLEHFVAQLWDKEIIEFERLKYSKIWKEK